MSIRLSKREVADVTGSPQRKRQIGFLRLNRIKHYVDEDGWPVVLWMHLDPSMQPVQDDRQTWKPHKAA